MSEEYPRLGNKNLNKLSLDGLGKRSFKKKKKNLKKKNYYTNNLKHFFFIIIYEKL